jgi:porin
MSTKSQTRVFIVIVVLLCSPGLARAQDASQAPGGTRPIADTPFQLILPREHLLGDWYGMRRWLEDHGITPTLTFVTDALGNPTGGQQQSFTAFSNLGVDLRFDLEKLYGPKGGSFEFSTSYRFGSSLSRKYIDNTFNVQQVCCGPTFRVVDVAYQQQLLDDRVEFRVGRIATGDDFLVSPYNYVFVQNGFDGNPVGIFFNSPGMTAYPNATWGALVKGKPTQRTYIMGGWYNGDPDIRGNTMAWTGQ